MQKERHKLQILAPSGSVEQLLAAVNNGCDAVYLGLDSFNARMKAPNFTTENLAQWVDYCHLFGVKVFVAVNTSIKNDEFARAVELLKAVYLCNADGVIVTDLALMRIAGNLPKPFDVVASTQLNVHDGYGAEFVKKLGASTVVCARECSLEQIKDIGTVGIDVECFLHGAMCVCQSGQCLFSSMVGGNSGNRGLCAQPCRKYYYAEGNGIDVGGYLLSARDMCSFHTVDQLIDAGATTFKIEGRNRRAEYAGIASRSYRRLFDGTANGKDQLDLAEMFNRGMSSNNYLRGDNSDVIFPLAQNHTGIVAGTVKSGGVEATCKLFKGDGLKVFDGAREVCGGIVLEESSGIVRAQFGGKVTDGMRVHRTTSVELCNEALSAKRKLDVSVRLVAKAGEKPIIAVTCNAVEARLEGDFIVQKALNKPTLHDELAVQLQKTGETHYTICDIVIEIDDIFIAKSQINALRRQALEQLTQKLVASYNVRFANRVTADLSLTSLFKSLEGGCDGTTHIRRPVCAVICCDEEQLARAKSNADLLIYKPRIIDKRAMTVASDYNAYIDLPSFADMRAYEQLSDDLQIGVVCHNVGQVEFARQHKFKFVAGGGLNLFNDYIVSAFADADAFVYSRELTLSEISAFTDKSGLTFVDGKIPLMQLCHCPYKVAYGCDCNICQAGKRLVYKDELGNRFEISRRQVGGQCTFELLNGNKLSVVARLKNSGRYLIDFDEDVLKHYISVNSGITDDYTESKPYTKGRLYDKIN